MAVMVAACDSEVDVTEIRVRGKTWRRKRAPRKVRIPNRVRVAFTGVRRSLFLYLLPPLHNISRAGICDYLTYCHAESHLPQSYRWSTSRVQQRLVRSVSPTMATVADELLNDFGDSGDENDEHVVEHEFHLGDTQDEHAGSSQNGDMDLDGDEEAVGDDGGGSDGNVPGHLKMDDDETAEETKARVEKLELQSVTDVRSVAGLMKQLDPLLKVSPRSHPPCTCHR